VMSMSVRLNVSLCVHEYISEITRPIFTNFYASYGGFVIRNVLLVERMTSYHRVQVNAPVASYWLCHIVDSGYAETRRVHHTRGVEAVHRCLVCVAGNMLL